jgi:CRP-like cAMP-binding protein
MEAEPADAYFIWGIDDSPYGPVPLDGLLTWIADERVAAETWVYKRPANCWQKAAELPELTGCFAATADFQPLPPSRSAVAPGSLRRIKILADLKDAQLAHLAEFLELQEAKQFKAVVRQGDAGDALFMVLAGELRARTTMGGRETILMTFSPGDIFGEMALFDQGPRSADVVANVDSALLKLTATAFQRLTREAPSLATPFLQATSRTLAARIRADNKRLTRVTEQFSASADH